MIAEAKRKTGKIEEGQLIEVVRKDHTGHTLRISKYFLHNGIQKPVCETIFDPDGNSTVYVYNENGKEVRQVLQFDKWSLPR